MAQLNSTIINGDLAVAGQINSGKGLVLNEDIVTNGGIIADSASINGNVLISGFVNRIGATVGKPHAISLAGTGTESSIRYTLDTADASDNINSWVVGLGCGEKTGDFSWWSNFNDSSGTRMWLDSNGALTVTGQITAPSFNATSDARLKENLVVFKPEKSILDLPIYKFDFIKGSKNNIGCLAQDLQKICPEIVHEGTDGYLNIEESKIVYLLLDEVKKLKAEVEELKK